MRVCMNGCIIMYFSSSGRPFELAECPMQQTGRKLPSLLLIAGQLRAHNFSLFIASFRFSMLVA